MKLILTDDELKPMMVADLGMDIGAVDFPGPVGKPEPIPNEVLMIMACEATAAGLRAQHPEFELSLPEVMKE
jgi:hypothetical protein